MALGARPGQILASVAGQAALLTAVGVAAGIAVAAALARVMASLMFGISPRDPLTFAVVPLILALVASAAALVPGRRAAALDPMAALRDD